jgi:hypothetical protein
MPIILATWQAEDYGSRPALANSLQDSHLQNNQSKIIWRCGSSSRAPALQVQSTKVNPNPIKKKKKTLQMSRKN